MEDNAYWYFLIEDTQTLIRSSLSYASRVRLGATCKTERLIMGQWLLKHAYESFCWDLGNENIIGFEASIFRRYKRRRADNPLHPITMKYVWDGKNPLFHENSNLSIVEAIGSDSILISKQKHIYKYHRSLAADNDIVAIKQLIENYKWLKGRSINSFNPVSLILGAIKADNWELIECLSAWFAESFEFDITQSMWVRLMGFDELKQNINFMAMNGLEVTMGYTEMPGQLLMAIKNLQHQSICKVQRPHDGFLNGCLHDMFSMLSKCLSKGSNAIIGILNRRIVGTFEEHFMFSIKHDEFRQRLLRGPETCNWRNFVVHAIKHGSLNVLGKLLAMNLTASGLVVACLEAKQLAALRLVMSHYKPPLGGNHIGLLRDLMNTDDRAIIDYFWNYMNHPECLKRQAEPVGRRIIEEMLMHCLTYGKLVSFEWWCQTFATNKLMVEDTRLSGYYHYLLRLPSEFYDLWIKYKLHLPTLEERHEKVPLQWLILGLSIDQAQVWLYGRLNMFGTIEHKTLLDSYIPRLKQMFRPAFDYYKTIPFYACTTFDSELRQYAADTLKLDLTNEVLEILKDIYQRDYC